MPALNLTSSDFLGAFMRLMPRGPVWPRDPDSVMGKSLYGLMPTYERSTSRANNLLIDAFPASTVELLPEWQSTLGLPDPCAGTDPLLGDEQAQVVARFTGRGKNQSADYFTAVAKSLGYDITITTFAPFRAGVSRAGDPCFSSAWSYAWQVNYPQFTISYFTAGDTAGSPLATWGSTVLQCELQRLAAAHTQPIFVYG